MTWWIQKKNNNNTLRGTDDSQGVEIIAIMEWNIFYKGRDG